MGVYTVNAADGPSEIQKALSDASSGETVAVSGDGTYRWRTDLRVPNTITLDVSNDVEIEIPRSHSIPGRRIGNRRVYSVISCADHIDPRNVTIRGGNYDMSAMPEQAGYAGIWLHNARDSLIDDAKIYGAGYSIRQNRTYRGFGLALTDATNCEIRDSEAHDSAYDDIAVRGGCRNCDIVRSGGSGGTSGTIQTARWGHWGLRDYPRGTTFTNCWGRRIYCHDGRDTVWDGCRSPYRIQTIGTTNALINGGAGR